MRYGIDYKGFVLPLSVYTLITVAVCVVGFTTIVRDRCNGSHTGLFLRTSLLGLIFNFVLRIYMMTQVSSSIGSKMSTIPTLIFNGILILVIISVLFTNDQSACHDKVPGLSKFTKELSKSEMNYKEFAAQIVSFHSKYVTNTEELTGTDKLIMIKMKNFFVNGKIAGFSFTDLGVELKRLDDTFLAGYKSKKSNWLKDANAFTDIKEMDDTELNQAVIMEAIQSFCVQMAKAATDDSTSSVATDDSTSSVATDDSTSSVTTDDSTSSVVQTEIAVATFTGELPDGLKVDDDVDTLIRTSDEFSCATAYSGETFKTFDVQKTFLAQVKMEVDSITKKYDQLIQKYPLNSKSQTGRNLYIALSYMIIIKPTLEIFNITSVLLNHVMNNEDTMPSYIFSSITVMSFIIAFYFPEQFGNIKREVIGKGEKDVD
jgi:hypothetical protein